MRERFPRLPRSGTALVGVVGAATPVLVDVSAGGGTVTPVPVPLEGLERSLPATKVKGAGNPVDTANKVRRS